MVTFRDDPIGSGIFIDGDWVAQEETFTVFDKYTQEAIAEVGLATEKQTSMAVAGAEQAARSPIPPFQRHDILDRAADLMEQRAKEIEGDYVAETGFTLADARGELARTIHIFRLCAGEAIRLAGEEIPVGAAQGSENRLAFTMRMPVGVVAAIAPFNAPLSTVAHKIGPAIAAGNGVVLNPATTTPLSALSLTRALVDAGLPPGYLQLVPGPGKRTGAALVSDDRIRYVTFTGSTAVGRTIRRESGLARTHLELGSNSVSIVAADAALDLVTRMVTRAGFRKAGQVCTSVQRLLVDRRVSAELGEQMVAGVKGLTAGDPRDPASDIGPLISEVSAQKAATWIDEARTPATSVVGGAREGSLLQPALVIAPSQDSSLFNDEVFAPVVTLTEVDSVDEAIGVVNAGPYGLQAGIFTQDVDLAFHAARHLHVGGVMINDTSSYHADAMPYGGVKESGHGVEGPRYLVEDMTDPRIVVMNLRSPHTASNEW